MKIKNGMIAILLLVAMCVACLSSCAVTGGVENDPDTYTVMLASGNTDGTFFVADSMSKTVEEGASVTFTVTPSAGYTLAFSAGAYDPATGTLTLANVSAHTSIIVTATADGSQPGPEPGTEPGPGPAPGPETFTVSLASGNTDGTFFVADSMSKSVAAGESAVFTVTPSTDYTLAFSLGNYDAATGTLTLSGVTENTVITVTATRNLKYSVTILTGENYTVAGDSTLSLNPGEDAVFTVTPATGYALSFSAGQYNVDTCRLTVPAVTGDLTITVTATSTASAKHTVSIKAGDGFSIIGDAVQEISHGESVTFRFRVNNNMKLVSVLDNGVDVTYTYNESRMTLTIDNIRKSMELTVTVGSDQKWYFSVTDGKANVSSGTMHSDGTAIRVQMESGMGTFLGWSVGKTLANGGTLVSEEAIYEFVLKDTTYLFGNYLNANSPYTIRYHSNGGTSPTGDVYVQTMTTKYYTSPNSMWDNGTFIRAGYVLLEYNTKADGTGKSYSLGSKIELDGVGGMSADLYCIWAKCSDAALFTTKDVSVTYKNSTFTGVAITGYSGTDAMIVIPETIGGKKVVQISSGAIKNKTMTSLVISRNVVVMEDGAVTGCSALKTLYFSDSVGTVTDAVFDAATYTNWTNFYINATIAPRFTSSYDGGYRVKWDRLMQGADGDMIVFVSGSSSLHGIATEYMEALFDNAYTVVNYGTVRTTNNLIYMEAVANYVDEGDIVIYGPENSIWQFGCTDLNYKTYRDLEACLNVFRYVDISNYDKVFSAYADYQGRRYTRAALTYEVYPNSFDENGDFQNAEHKKYCVKNNYKGNFTITFNDQVKSTKENLSNANDNNWIAINTYADFVKEILGKVEATGAKVYFGFCSVNENALTAEAKTVAQQQAFDQLIASTFDIEVLGSSGDHVFNWKYMFAGTDGSDFHLNDYGRPIYTYSFYTKLCAKLGITPKGMKDAGTTFDGCNFE